MANEDSQIRGLELRQQGLPNEPLMRLLYDCKGIISIPKLNININLKDIQKSFFNELIPSLITKELQNYGSTAYIDENLFKSIVKDATLLTNKNYTFNYQDRIKNKINVSIPKEWYIEIALDTSLVSFHTSAIWLKDNNYQGINEKRGISEDKIETFRALLSSPQRAEEARKWRDYAAKQKGKEQRAALCAAKKWEGATHAQAYDALFPNRVSNSLETKKSCISRLMREAKEISQKNQELKLC